MFTSLTNPSFLGALFSPLSAGRESAVQPRQGTAFNALLHSFTDLPEDILTEETPEMAISQPVEQVLPVPVAPMFVSAGGNGQMATANPAITHASVGEMAELTVHPVQSKSPLGRILQKFGVYNTNSISQTANREAGMQESTAPAIVTVPSGMVSESAFPGGIVSLETSATASVPAPDAAVQTAVTGNAAANNPLPQTGGIQAENVTVPQPVYMQQVSGAPTVHPTGPLQAALPENAPAPAISNASQQAFTSPAPANEVSRPVITIATPGGAASEGQTPVVSRNGLNSSVKTARDSAPEMANRPATVPDSGAAPVKASDASGKANKNNSISTQMPAENGKIASGLHEVVRQSALEMGSHPADTPDNALRSVAASTSHSETSGSPEAQIAYPARSVQKPTPDAVMPHIAGRTASANAARPQTVLDNGLKTAPVTVSGKIIQANTNPIFTSSKVADATMRSQAVDDNGLKDMPVTTGSKVRQSNTSSILTNTKVADVTQAPTQQAHREPALVIAVGEAVKPAQSAAAERIVFSTRPFADSVEPPATGRTSPQRGTVPVAAPLSANGEPAPDQPVQAKTARMNRMPDTPVMTTAVKQKPAPFSANEQVNREMPFTPSATKAEAKSNPAEISADSGSDRPLEKTANYVKEMTAPPRQAARTASHSPDILQQNHRASFPAGEVRPRFAPESMAGFTEQADAQPGSEPARPVSEHEAIVATPEPEHATATQKAKPFVNQPGAVQQPVFYGNLQTGQILTEAHYRPHPEEVRGLLTPQEMSALLDVPETGPAVKEIPQWLPERMQAAPAAPETAAQSEMFLRAPFWMSAEPALPPTGGLQRGYRRPFRDGSADEGNRMVTDDPAVVPAPAARGATPLHVDAVAEAVPQQSPFSSVTAEPETAAGDTGFAELLTGKSENLLTGQPTTPASGTSTMPVIHFRTPEQFTGRLAAVLQEQFYQLAERPQTSPQQLFIQLEPREMGVIRLRLRMKQHKLVGSIETAMPETSALLQQNHSQLLGRLQEMGVQVQEFNINYNDQLGSQQQFAREQSGQPGSGKDSRNARTQAESTPENRPLPGDMRINGLDVKV